jgi:RNA polymerase sigma-70 factor (ECF subfamily)
MEPFATSPAPVPDDATLMAGVQSGDREAFAILVDRYRDDLVGYLVRLTGERERAEDLAQEAFVRLYQRSGSYVEEGHLAAYLYRIATNLLRTEERRRRRWWTLEPRLEATLEPAARSDGPQRVFRAELQQTLARALAELPLHFRVPVVLFEVEDWTLEEIADWLGCRVGTVKSRLHRGRRRLRESLAPHWNGDHP